MAARKSPGPETDRSARGTGRAGKSPIGDAVPEMVRKALSLGLSGFFTTEETLRRALGDTIPQDWVDFAAAQSDKTRRDFASAVAQEVGRVLERMDLAEIAGRVFENRSLEISARVRILPREEGEPPSARLERVDYEVVDEDGDDAP